MKTTVEFLDEVKAKHGLPSDYALAKHLGLTRQHVSHLRAGTNYLGDDTALKVAESLEVAPGYVLANVAAERTKSSNARKAWERAAKLLGGVAASVAIMTGTAMGIDAETASLLAFADTFNMDSVYYVKLLNPMMAAAVILCFMGRSHGTRN